MKPIPAQSSRETSSTDTSPSSASDLLKSAASKPANSNRRSPQAVANRAYPILLIISTAVAAFFGFMYMNKPVVVAGTDSSTSDISISDKGIIKGNQQELLPRGDNLPGEVSNPNAASSAPRNLTTAPLHSRYEETNMRVQHILTATSDDGHVSRIDLEVPVLYQSRQLRWSQAEVKQANQLMLRLMDYQDKSRQLKSQGQKLLNDWNMLIGKSIPASKLRADSPSIPENQHSALALSGPSSSDGAVEIDPKEDQP